MYLAQNLKYLRERNGETQKDISEILSAAGYGFSEMSVSRYESGECEPDLKKVIMLADHFEVTIDDLIRKDMSPPKLMYAGNLKYFREKYGMSQGETAKLLGLKDKSSCCLVESGKRKLSVEQLVKVSEYFGTTLDQLVKQDLSKEV